MADILALRTTLRALTPELAAAQANLDALEEDLQDAAGDVPPGSPLIAGLRAEVQEQAAVVRSLTTRVNDATAAYQAAVLADPIHAMDPGLPLVLLPVRIETAYLPDPSGPVTDLVVRVYPDDIHVDSHEPELTADELAAGTEYWQNVWGAGPNQSRLDAAWSMILGQLKPNRAAWAVYVLTPAEPPPTVETPPGQPQPIPILPVVPSRPATFNRAARTTLLPDHWNFIGVQGGQELFNIAGSPIPDSLDVSFGPPGTGATDSDLPFGPSSRWLVDLDAAIANGMAVRIPLPGPNYNLDQLFVLGVSASLTPGDAVTRLQSCFTAHQFTNGLAFLPPGSPTNNTAQTRSSWQSAPQPPTPTQWNQARAAYQPASNQNAAVLARALGIDGSQTLAVADEGLLDQQFAITMLQQQFWTATGSNTLSQIYSTWVIPPGGVASQGTWQLNVNAPQVQALQDHAGGWVRSRGTLPVLRVGNQPYGMLPALSLDDWVPAADDPTLQFFTWLTTLRDYWLAAVANVPRVLPNGDPNADSTVVDVLSRLPVSVDILIRADGNPATTAVAEQPLPVAPIPGLPVNSQLFLSVPADTAAPLGLKVVSDPVGDQQNVMLPSLQLYRDGLSVIEGAMTSADFQTKYKPFFSAKSFPGAPPADLFINFLQDSFTNPLLQGSVNTLNSIPALILCGGIFYDPTKTDPDSLKFDALLQANLPACKDFVEHYSILCTVDPAAYETSLRETLDVFSHRLDAWITSLAARRLDQMRATEPSGLVIGAYGWVEDLAPRTDLTPAAPPPAGFDQAFSSPLQTYIHAPSLQHAATAAVLRSGYDSHADATALAVNLVSSRVRVADWLAEGVRNGQTVGALLGYRFERGLQDAGLDNLIAPLRQEFPLPLPANADSDVNGSSSRTAIAARNVVDGLALYNNPAAALEAVDSNPGVVPLLDDLTNVMDAFGDLLLAESVHHLVGGNPLRAGLAADTVGRGEPVPDRFDFALTPRSGQPLSWQVGALLPADFLSAASGWQTSRPRATAEPHLDAWAATMLGNASTWQIACTLTSGNGVATQNVGLDTLGLSALDVVTEISGSPSTLELRVVEALSASLALGTSISILKTPNADGSLGFGELFALCQRVQLAFGKASPLTPQNLQGSGTSAVLGLDVADLDTRAAALATSFSAAVQAMTSALSGLQSVDTKDAAATGAAVQALRAALIALADHGIPASWPAAPAATDSATIAVLSAQAASLSPSVQALAAQPQPPAPVGGADDFTVAAWLSSVVAYVQGILGEGFPLIPIFSLPAASAYAAAFSPASAPVGADASAIMLWLRRTARIRPNSLALHDVLLAAESLQTTPIQVTAAQLPPLPGPQWIGLPFVGSSPPGARLALVFSTPAPIDPSLPFCGFVCDTWTEQVPGLTTVAGGKRGYEASEVSGMAFTTDGPNAQAPQCLLLAIAPDPTKGWSLDILFDTVTETLDLAKMRTVDLGDLPRLGRVLPAIHSGYNVDQLIQAGATS
jgi:hypothetical protein